MHLQLRLVALPAALVAATVMAPLAAAVAPRHACRATPQEPTPTAPTPTPTPAPQPAPPARPDERLQQQLLRGAAVEDRSFEFQWTWSQERRSVMQHRAKTPIRPIRPGTASGSLHAELLCLQVPAADDTDWLQVGTEVLARKAGGAWRRVERLEIVQNGAAFSPDPRRLLRTLAETPFVVRNRLIEEIDGKPMELVALELPPESGDRLHRAGAIPDPNPVAPSLRATMQRHGVDPTLVPAPVLDVAVVIDVASQHVVGVTVRALLAPVDTHAILQAAGGRSRPSEDDTKALEAIQKALRGDGAKPFVYRAGLPERDATGAELRVLTCRIGGPAKRPELDEQQTRLLQPR